MRRLAVALTMGLLACGDDGAATSDTTGSSSDTDPTSASTSSPSSSDSSTTGESSTTEDATSLTDSGDETTMGGSVSTSGGGEESSSSGADDTTTDDTTTTGDDTTTSVGEVESDVESDSVSATFGSTFGPGSDTESGSSESGAGCLVGIGGGPDSCGVILSCPDFEQEMSCDADTCVCLDDGVQVAECDAMMICDMDFNALSDYALTCCGIDI